MSPTRKRILIIDDEQDISAILTFHFSKLGFDISVARDGAEGLIKAVAQVPQLVLLDIRMPKGDDGLTFLRRLRSFRSEDPDQQSLIRHIPVIVMTAAGGQMRALFEQEGISDFVAKPFDFEDLKARIQKILSAS